MASLVTDPNVDSDLLLKTSDTEVQVKIRNGAKSFLEDLARDHEIVVYDCRPAELINQVLQAIDPHFEIFSLSLTAAHCSAGGRKDLRVLLGRDLTSIRYISSVYDLPCDQLSAFVPIFPPGVDYIECNQQFQDLLAYLKQGREPSSDEFGLGRVASSIDSMIEVQVSDIVGRVFNF